MSHFQRIHSAIKRIESFLKPATSVVEPEERAQCLLDQDKFAIRNRPDPCSPQVIHLGGQLGKRFSLRRTTQASIRLAEIRQVIPAVTLLCRSLFFWAFGQVFSGKLSDEFMEIITPS